MSRNTLLWQLLRVFTGIAAALHCACDMDCTFLISPVLLSSGEACLLRKNKQDTSARSIKEHMLMTT